jgi:hypothetical protein
LKTTLARTGIAHTRTRSLGATAASRKSTAEPVSEEIGSYEIGFTRHTLHRRGRRYSLAIHHVECLQRGVWKTLAGEMSLALCATLTRAIGSHARDGKSVLRVRTERRPLSYAEALLLVRDRILLPAIGAAIPPCMRRDLRVSVVMDIPPARRGGRHAQQTHIVGATPIEPTPPRQFRKAQGDHAAGRDPHRPR